MYREDEDEDEDEDGVPNFVTVWETPHTCWLLASREAAVQMCEDFLWGPSTLSSNTKPGACTVWCSTLQ